MSPRGRQACPSLLPPAGFFLPYINPSSKSPTLAILLSPTAAPASQMAPPVVLLRRLLFSLLLISPTAFAFHSSAYPPHRSLILVQQQPLILRYHNGPLLKGNLTVNLLWYGRFSPSQRAIIADFLRSLSPTTPPAAVASPSVSSWWATTASYRGGAAVISLGREIFDSDYSLGRSLTAVSLRRLARRGGSYTPNAITAVFTADDVAVEGFCMSRCGLHGAAREGGRGGVKFPFVWVGNPAAQCPGQCAWPYARPEYGPPASPLVAPNGDVGVEGMVINLATLMAGVVTNPYGNGYFQGPATAPLEAVTACTGIFGSGAYPGFPGNVLVDKKSGASFNALGVNGREFLLPAMWDPNKFNCATLV
ncbi:hypothetical protein KSP40_PGU016848 [Platanthera guangdongensis]|uniref:Protein EXORDIUM-like 2 n=1 Tax=Platanthera guangdongensis TaxID=2320717 RepID=A0ABR2LHI5_9ASPA